ncbi:hypothetical protein ACWGDE_07585 [Streptomyces sp. NPDC054956]
MVSVRIPRNPGATAEQRRRRLLERWADEDATLSATPLARAAAAVEGDEYEYEPPVRGGLRGAQEKPFQRIHPQPQKGCHWAGGEEFWTPAVGPVIIDYHLVADRHNGKRISTCTFADLLIVDHTLYGSWRYVANVWISGAGIAGAVESAGPGWRPYILRRYGRAPWQAIPGGSAVPGWEYIVAGVADEGDGAEWEPPGVSHDQ